MLPVESKVFRRVHAGSQVRVDLGPAHMSNESIAHAGTEPSCLSAIRVPSFRFEYGVGKILIGQSSGLRQKVVNLQRQAIDSGTAELEADADVFQQIVIGGAHLPTVAEQRASARGRVLS